MATDARIGTELAGYRILELLGRGGMSVVYLAEDIRLKRKAALKVLATDLANDQAFRQRFISESELAASLDHPNVIPIFEAGEADGELFIAMRYVRSTDLKALLERQGRLPPSRAIALLAQAASALDTAASEGLVHRDVKPGNILVAEGQGSHGADHVYLSDFGLTKRARERSGLTRTGQFVGTVEYVAPEQIEGRDLDGRTDQYALACVLYECITGQSPYPKDTETAVLIAHLMDQPPTVSAVAPSLPPALDAVVAKGMAKNKDDRYPDCSSLIKAASDAIASGALTRETPPPSPPVFVTPAPGRTFEPAPPDPTAGGAPPPERQFEAPLAPPMRAPARKKRSRVGSLIIAAVVAGLVAGGVVLFLSRGDGGNGNGASPSTDFGTPLPANPGDVIFFDDFSSEAGLWDSNDFDAFQQGYTGGGEEEGRYFQQIKQNRPEGEPDVFASAFPHVPQVAVLGDVKVTVRTHKSTGSGRNGFGIACRTNEGTLSYYFVISDTKGYAIQKSDGVSQINLASSTTPSIQAGGENEIEAHCVGGAEGVTLSLFVNGTEVHNVTDTPDAQQDGDNDLVYPSGTVGLVTVGPAGLSVEFDDFRVTAL